MGFDTKDIRYNNRLDIMHTIIQNSPISRAEISKITNLNKATISTIVNELIHKNLIKEISIGNSTGGRKPILIESNYEYGYIIGIDIRISNILIIVSNLKNEIIKKYKILIEKKDFDYNFNKIIETINKINLKYTSDTYKLLGIGISVRGLVDLNSIIKFVHILNWTDIDLAHMLSEIYNVPIFLDHEGNLSALEESKIYKNINSLAFISIDEVVSAGLILDRKIYNGSRGYATSIAHHIIDFNGEKCFCGQKGCFNNYVAYTSILKKSNCDNLDEFIEKLKNKDKLVVKIFKEFNEAMIAALTNIIYLYDLDIIIINCSLLEKIPNALENITKKLNLPVSKKQKINFSKSGEFSSIKGALSLVISNFYKNTLK